MNAARLRVSVACVLAAFLAAGVAIGGMAAAGTDRAQTREAIPSFHRVVVVVFENKEFDQVIGSPDAPTFRSLARRYALLTNYRAVAHPSLPNYIAMVSGSTQGVASDCTSCQVSAPNLADALERAGMTWKTYAEGLPRAGFTGAEAGRYAKKHNPLVYFTDVVSSPDRLRRIVPLRSFARDLAAGRLPDFSLVVPDRCHDMHDCSVARGRRVASDIPWPAPGSPGTPARGRLPRVRRGRLGRRGRGSCPCTRPRAARSSRITHLDAARPLRAAADNRGRLGPTLAGTVPRLTGDHGHLALAPRCFPLGLRDSAGRDAAAVPAGRCGCQVPFRNAAGRPGTVGCVIEARNLTKDYGSKRAVDDLSFTVEPGVVTGFLGPNGSGKSTTMRLILGLDGPTAGEVSVNGEHYRDHAAPLHEVGALLEARSVHTGRSAYNHLLALAQTHGITKRRVQELIDFVGLHDVARQRAGQFSLGMGQRLGIATALLGDPKTVILDEPANGLDPEGIHWMRHLLRGLADEGRTVFVSSHLMSEMALDSRSSDRDRARQADRGHERR